MACWDMRGNCFLYRYCDHVVNDEINEEVEKLLNSLRYFQDRQYLKDPTKVRN